MDESGSPSSVTDPARSRVGDECGRAAASHFPLMRGAPVNGEERSVLPEQVKKRRLGDYWQMYVVVLHADRE
jgi:hypothetical protein